MTTTTTLYRASDDDYIQQGTSFAEARETAEQYLDNPGFGGASLWSCSIEIDDGQILDLRGLSVSEAADLLGQTDPGAIGIDEWLPRTVAALDAARERGCLWALVSESYPADTTTWIWIGTCEDDEPELERAN